MNFTCDMQHTSQIPAPTIALADLAGGWHAIWKCPICSRVCASPIPESTRLHLAALGAHTSTDAIASGAANTYAVARLGKLTSAQIDLWADVLGSEDADTLIRAWANNPGTEVAR